MIAIMKYKRVFVLFVLLLTGLGIVLANPFKLPKLPKIPEIPGLDRVLHSEPPVTTSLPDAVTEISFLDDYDPELLIPMTRLPRTSDGSFLLERPGLFEITVESYCIKAGTYAPAEGSGYLYARLKGPQADIVHKVLQGAYEHPEIPQRDIQVLLWAIIARTKISDMSQDNQITAAKLLTPSEIFKLNGGALSLVPRSMFEKAFENIPEPALSIMKAEAELREKLTETEATYDELERIAVLTGSAPIGEGSRVIPRGRWSYHPDGYFIRFFPYGYQRDEIQLYVPEPIIIERDGLGRITLIEDSKGNNIELDYDDDIDPVSASDDPGVTGYAFSSIHFVNRVVIPPEVSLNLKAKWDTFGWTLVGVPNGRGTLSATGRFSEFKERYQFAMEHKEEIERLDKQLKSNGDINEFIDLCHLKIALKEVIKSNQNKDIKWIPLHIDLVTKAWQYEFSKRVGSYIWGYKYQEDIPHNMFLTTVIEKVFNTIKSCFSAYASEDKIPWFNPNENVGTPANTSNQRIANSKRPTGKKPCEQVQNALAFARLVRQSYEDVDPSKYNNGKDYNDAVMKELNNKLKKEGKAGANPGSQSNAPNGTHPTNCNLAPGGPGANYKFDWAMYHSSSEADFQEYIKETYFKDSPEIIWEGNLTHEQSHMKTCREQTKGGNKNGYKDYMNNPENYKKDEISAYDAQINKLEKWLKDNCK